MDALIPQHDLRLLVGHLSSRKISELRAWCEVCVQFLAAKPSQRMAVAQRLAETYAGRIHGGLSLKTIYRRAAKYRQEGWRGLVHGNDLRVITSGSALRSNTVFLTYWQDCVANTIVAQRRPFVRSWPCFAVVRRFRDMAIGE